MSKLRRTGRRLLIATLATALLGVAATPALAHSGHGRGDEWGPGWGYGWCPGMMGMGPGMMGMGPSMMGPGMMGPGMMGPGMMGPGMMGPGTMGPGTMGMGPGMQLGMTMGPGGMTALPKDLSTDEVRHMLEHRVAWHWGAGYTVGKVEEKDADTIAAEILAADGGIARKLEIDRHTGWMTAVQ